MTNRLLQRRSRSLQIVLSLIALSVICIVMSLLQGTYAITWGDYRAILIGHHDIPAYTVLSELRLPRVLTGFATGGLLALAGALMQVLLRNPLAEPYVLGISGGASVVTLLLMLLGASGLVLSLGAFGGALLSMLLVFSLAHGAGSWTPSRLLLTGVILAAGWGALITLILSIAPDVHLRGMLFWLMGDLAHAQSPIFALSILLFGLILSWIWSPSLNLLALGHTQAQTLGVSTNRLQWQLLALTSLLTATAIMQAGSIGFVGLIVPHLLRLIGLNDHRYLVPASIFAGGSLLVIADTLARSLFVDIGLPVGIFTALLGVPIFLWLLQRQAGQST